MCRLINQNEIGSCQDSILKMQHMNCCNIRNYKWNRKNKALNHLFNQSAAWEKIIAFHLLILKEMSERAMKYDLRWSDPSFRGIRYKTLDPLKYSYMEIKGLFTKAQRGKLIYHPDLNHDQEFVPNNIIPKAVRI